MNILKMKTLIFLLLIWIVPFSFGQIKNSFGKIADASQISMDPEQKGNKMYSIFAYSQAIEHYSKADSLTVIGLGNLADSYARMEQFKNSLDTYRNLVERSDCMPQDYFRYANMLKINGFYKEADFWMQKYHLASPEEIRAQLNVAEINESVNLRKNKGEFKIENLGINTDKQEFGSVLYGNQLVYSSNAPRKGIIIKKYIWTNEPFLDFYVTDTLQQNEITRTPFELKFNKKYHEGTITFTGDLQRVYFTANNYKSKSSNGIIKLQLYFADKQLDGTWGEPQLHEFSDKEFSIGHPWVSNDGKTLYFSSDKPGGFGGVDIYRSTMNENETWSTPENLGAEINTEGDEMYPYFNEEDQIFFFSSNGHFGLGGLDIYAVAIHHNFFGKVNNLGTPLNSSYDDFGVVFKSNMNRGYFSSNRIDGKGGDDIYAISYLKKLKLEESPKEIKGTVMNQDSELLDSVSVVLYDTEMNAIDSLLTDSTGRFSFIVDPYRDYSLIGTLEKHKDDSSSVSLDILEESVTIDLTLVREKIEPVFIEVDHQLFLSVQTIYFDLNSSELRADTRNLDHVIEVMNDFPNMVIELGSHTDCRGTKDYNQRLSDERAKSSTEYIKERITNPDRISGKGYGETQLINDCACEGKITSNCEEEEHQNNRRTEFKIISQ